MQENLLIELQGELPKDHRLHHPRILDESLKLADPFGYSERRFCRPARASRQHILLNPCDPYIEICQRTSTARGVLVFGRSCVDHGNNQATLAGDEV